MTAPAPAAQVAAPRRAAGVWFLVLALVAFVLVKIADLLLVLFIAALLAVVLGGLTDILSRRLRVPRGLGLVLSLALMLGLLAALVSLLAPAVGNQVQDFAEAVPRYLAAFDQWLRRLAASSAFLRRTGIASSETGIVTTAINDAIAFARRSVFEYATAGGALAIDSVAVIVMALYLAWRPSLYRDGIVQIVPPRARAVARVIFDDANDTLRAWAGAQLLAMVVLATLTGIGLWAMSVPYWLAFSALAGVVVMIPFFGSIVSTLLPALLILPERGPIAFLAVASIGVVVHIIEANVVGPLIMQHKVALPPVLTIFSVLVMGRLAGLLGLFVAVPLLATLLVVLRHVVIYQLYGERPGEPMAHAVLRPSRSSMAATA
ncbi:MAG: AI-2E family transporter [Gemmatimonadales bacterium]